MKRLYQRTYFENRLGINQKKDLKIIREKPDGLYMLYMVLILSLMPLGGKVMYMNQNKDY